MNVREAAKRLETCDQQVYALCREGRLGHYRIGTSGKRGKIVITEEDITAFLDSVRISPSAPRRTAPVTLRHLQLPPRKSAEPTSRHAQTRKEDETDERSRS